MEAQNLLLQLILGGLLGITGQGLRIIVGLKKLYDKSSEERKPFSDLFSTNFLLLSIFIGFIAGTLAIVGASEFGVKTTITKEMTMTLIASGYAGTDFIEGFISKFLPKTEGASQQPTTNEPDEQPAIG
jgi:hypothetical protein